MAADSPTALILVICAGAIAGAAAFATWLVIHTVLDVRRHHPPGLGAVRGETGPHLPEGRSPRSTSFRRYHARIRRQIKRAERDVYRDVRGGRR